MTRGGEASSKAKENSWSYTGSSVRRHTTERLLGLPRSLRTTYGSEKPLASLASSPHADTSVTRSAPPCLGGGARSVLISRRGRNVVGGGGNLSLGGGRARCGGDGLLDFV